MAAAYVRYSLELKLNDAISYFQSISLYVINHDIAKTSIACSETFSQQPHFLEQCDSYAFWQFRSCMVSNFHSFIFMPTFRLERVAE